MSSERHYFWSAVTDTHTRDPRLSPKYKIPRGTDTKIGLRYYKISGRSWINAPDATVFNVPKLIARKLVLVNLSNVKKSSKRGYHIDYMAKKLSKIGVPGHDQLDVLEKIFDMIDVIHPGRHIIVFLADVTVQLLDSVSNFGEGDVRINGRLTDNQQIMLQRLMMDSRCDVPKGTPATLSSVQDLEKVRLDSLEAAVRQLECPICMEGLDHFYAAEEGIDHHHMIVRLPCSHMYHEDCIGQWLENNQRCPLCRCTVVKLHKASKPPLRLRWSMVMLSAVGLLTVALIPELLYWRSRVKISPNRVPLSDSHVFGW